MSAPVCTADIVRAGFDEMLTFVAASVCFAVNECAPAPSVETANDHSPPLPTTAVPSDTTPSNTSIVAPTSPVPERVGVNEYALSAFIVGAAGLAVSILSEATLESALVLPAESVADAVMLYVASASELGATLHAPNWSAVVVATSDVPEYSFTMACASAVPESVGVEEFFANGDPEIKGADGRVVSTTTTRFAL
jgi:hypothetical protein